VTCVPLIWTMQLCSHPLGCKGSKWCSNKMWMLTRNKSHFVSTSQDYYRICKRRYQVGNNPRIGWFWLWSRQGFLGWVKKFPKCIPTMWGMMQSFTPLLWKWDHGNVECKKLLLRFLVYFKGTLYSWITLLGKKRYIMPMFTYNWAWNPSPLLKE
jgi:hypothetical protein